MISWSRFQVIPQGSFIKTLILSKLILLTEFIHGVITEHLYLCALRVSAVIFYRAGAENAEHLWALNYVALYVPFCRGHPGEQLFRRQVIHQA